ncbi:MAG: carbohydrate ABC transporter permease [Chloroflexota bacterium]
MTATSSEFATVAVKRKTRIRGRRIALHLFLLTMALVWLFPLLYALYTSLRPYEDTARLGYVSIGGTYNVDNYIKAFTDGHLLSYFFNTAIVVVPAVLLTLLLASMAAFVLSRFSWRFNLLFLMLFTAGNLLPQQVIITPLFRMFLLLPLPPILSDNGVWYDQYFGVIAIHVAFQLGFCTFVLSNYMKTLPTEMTEAAVVDGASVFQIYSRVIMPLVRPAFAALVVLETTWIYNDFFWALLLMKSGERMPITSALNNLKGNFFVDNNLIAAGAIIVALPTMIVFFAAQKQFISGLTLGSTKG